MSQIRIPNAIPNVNVPRASAQFLAPFLAQNGNISTTTNQDLRIFVESTILPYVTHFLIEAADFQGSFEDSAIEYNIPVLENFTGKPGNATNQKNSSSDDYSTFQYIKGRLFAQTNIEITKKVTNIKDWQLANGSIENIIYDVIAMYLPRVNATLSQTMASLIATNTPTAHVVTTNAYEEMLDPLVFENWKQSPTLAALNGALVKYQQQGVQKTNSIVELFIDGGLPAGRLFVGTSMLMLMGITMGLRVMGGQVSADAVTSYIGTQKGFGKTPYSWMGFDVFLSRELEGKGVDFAVIPGEVDGSNLNPLKAWIVHWTETYSLDPYDNTRFNSNVNAKFGLGIKEPLNQLMFAGIRAEAQIANGYVAIGSVNSTTVNLGGSVKLVQPADATGSAINYTIQPQGDTTTTSASGTVTLLADGSFTILSTATLSANTRYYVKIEAVITGGAKAGTYFIGGNTFMTNFSTAAISAEPVAFESKAEVSIDTKSVDTKSVKK